MAGNRRGFTLLEVLVATTLLAVMAGFLAVAFRMASASVSRGEEGVREAARLRAAVGVVERALRSADPMPLPGDGPAAPWFLGERDRVRFLTSLPPAGIPAAGLRLLSLRKGERGGLALQDASPFRVGAREWEGTGEERPLLAGVTRVALSYSSGPDGEGRWEWTDSWDSGERGALPAAVRVELTVSRGEGGERTTAFVTPIPGGGSP